MDCKPIPKVTKEFIEENSIPVTETGCWIWVGRTNSRGYGYPRLYFNSKKDSFLAHRLSYEVYYNRTIPLDYNINHRCDNTLCVNPNHLYIGTQKENVKDCVDKNRRCDFSGKKNPRYDNKIYTLFNVQTEERYTGTKYEFMKAYKNPDPKMYSLFNGKISKAKGWVLIQDEIH